MDLGDFEGFTYGPHRWWVASDPVRDFIDLTGDDHDRWKEVAPPGFAAAALFSVAPELLDRLSDRSIIHGEQTFTWTAPIRMGAQLEVMGTVTRVRDRGGVNFVTFEMEGKDGSKVILGGKSLFLVSGDSQAAGESAPEQPEPPHSYRGEVSDGQVSASRADLVRYASATRDWNPVHWDHDAGLAAGFPRVVVHGLLQAGWVLRAATPSQGDRPFESARFRFRNPLLPGRPATVTAEESRSAVDVTLADDDLVYLTASVAMSDE